MHFSYLRHPIAALRPRLLGRSPRARTSQTRLASNAVVKIPSEPSTGYLKPTYDLSSPPTTRTASTLALGEQYLLPIYARPPIVLSHGRGCWVWDTEGRKYLDFSAGIAVNALGHADPGVAEVLHTQASTLLHSSNVYHNEWTPKLAEVRVFFANSGTEANEGALKIARKVGKDRWAASTGNKPDDPACSKTKIVCFENAFHGRSMGALSVTPTEKYQAPFRPLIPGVDVGKVNDFERLQDLITDETCAVIIEPVQGEGGVTAADEQWLMALRERCNETGAVLIYDEIQNWDNPLANGYPIGAVLLRDTIASTMTAGTHGTTFGGSPMACAMGHYVLSRLSAPSFIAHISDVSKYLNTRLELLPKWFPDILQTDVRGRGLIRALGFKNEKHPGRVVELARERGVFLLTAGNDAVRLVPPLTVNEEEIELAMDVLEGSLGALQN
ncbi:acetylornithine aminotransferase [Pisolithus sp. B1]|nr:acetylornithine aminotransferase [Pisolithus sp. B1]